MSANHDNPASWGRFFGVILIGATLLAYWPALPGGFVWDDDAHITAPELRTLTGLQRIWIEPGATQQYYPLLHSVFWVEHKFWGNAPLGYHVVNIALHITAAFLVRRVLRRLNIPGAGLAALIFALHPVQVESVAWVTELKNTLSTVFYLTALLVYLRFDETRDKRTYAGALALFALALMSKTVTATLPAALLVILWWRRGALSWSRDVRPMLPMLVLGAAAGLFTAWVERRLVGAEGAEFHLTFVERLLLAGRVPWFYLGKLVWPVELTFIYPRWQISQSSWWEYLFALATVLTFAALFVWRCRSRAPLAGAMFFVGTLFPVLGFFNVYPFRYSFVADHFQYLACLGVIVPVSAWVWRRNARTALGAVLVSTLAVLSERQAATYASAETLYLATIARNPGCWMAHNNLGGLYLEQNRLNEAIEHIEAVLRFKTNDAGVYNNLGTAFARQGKPDAALAQFQQAVRVEPDFADARLNLGNALADRDNQVEAAAQFREAVRIRPDYSEAHYNLANTLMRQSRPAEALAHYQQAVRFAPGDADTRFTLANLLAQQGNTAAAVRHYLRVVRIRPDFVAAHYNLANTLVRLGQPGAAVEHYRVAIFLKPDMLPALFNLATALVSDGKPQEAIVPLQQVLALQPDLAEAHYKLGTTWAKLGKFDDATNCCDRALRLNAELSPALADCAWLLATHDGATTNDVSRAVEWAARACHLTRNADPACLDALAAAYAAAGQFSNAVTVASQALDLAKAPLQRQIAERLNSYRAGRPYRADPTTALPSDW